MDKEEIKKTETIDENHLTKDDNSKDSAESAIEVVEPLQVEVLPPENGDLPFVCDEDILNLYNDNFLEYASYVIKERAIPDVYDGLKPVQRRIMFSMFRMDDGRYHKVANIIGHTMQFHPHGDASIGSALVILANKDFFIDKQGNFGNIYTGDPASAARYIEARLTPLALEVMFNNEITSFVDSYDGRNEEPVSLPAKVPALLMQGAEGIAVGMSTKILPHNFVELLLAQIAILEEKPYRIYPDFLTGGTMDVSDYNDGDGKVLVRAKVDIISDKKLIVKEIPPGTSTESLISSIEDAVRKDKIKISSINDYTAEHVEIEILLPRGVHAEEILPRLYAYTDCELSVRSKIIVINQKEPVQMLVKEVLELNTKKLVQDLERELNIQLQKLRDKFHDKTLAQIFIENRIYKRIEECPSYEEVIEAVFVGLSPFRDKLERDISNEDVEKLLQIRIRRISRFDIDKNQQELDDILLQIEEVLYHLDNLTDFTINYINNLLLKYGKSYPRHTRIKELEEIDVREVARENIKVGHDRTGHFIGTDIKNSNKNEDYLACTEFDRLVMIKNSGSFKVLPIPDKMYTGPVKYLFKSDKEQVFSIIYKEKKSKKIIYYAKRFKIDKYIMDKEYNIIPKDCTIVSLHTTYGVVLSCNLEENKRLTSQEEIINFDDIQIRSTAARGFKITHYPVKNISVLKRGTNEAPLTPEQEAQKSAELINNAKEVQPLNLVTVKQAKSWQKKHHAFKLKQGRKKTNKSDANPATSAKVDANPANAAKVDANPANAAKSDAKPANSAKVDANPANSATNSQKKSKSLALPRRQKHTRKLIDEDTPFFLE